MPKLLRLLLSLCCALLLCVGFSSENNIAHAYEDEQITGRLYPFNANDVWIRFHGYPSGVLYSEYCYPESIYTYWPDDVTKIQFHSAYQLNNPALDNISAVSLTCKSFDQIIEIPFLPSLYDYYLVGTMVGQLPNGSHDTTSSTWKPSNVRVLHWEQELNGAYDTPVDNEHFYNIDSDLYRGFSFSARVDFSAVGSVAIRGIELNDDIDGYGSKPANQLYMLGIVAVEKNSSNASEQILTAIVNMEQALADTITETGEQISGAVSDAANQLEEVINNQYHVDEDENLGIEDMTQDLEDKMGLLSFSGDVLGDFVGLFDEANATAPVLTFPAFGMEVQGELYQVWDSYDYNLRDLEEQFPVLIDAVRLVSGLLIWLLLFNYIAKIADEFLRS